MKTDRKENWKWKVEKEKENCGNNKESETRVTGKYLPSNFVVGKASADFNSFCFCMSSFVLLSVPFCLASKNIVSTKHKRPSFVLSLLKVLLNSGSKYFAKFSVSISSSLNSDAVLCNTGAVVAFFRVRAFAPVDTCKFGDDVEFPIAGGVVVVGADAEIPAVAGVCCVVDEVEGCVVGVDVDVPPLFGKTIFGAGLCDDARFVPVGVLVFPAFAVFEGLTAPLFQPLNRLTGLSEVVFPSACWASFVSLELFPVSELLLALSFLEFSLLPRPPSPSL